MRLTRAELVICVIGAAEAVVYGFSFPWFSLTLEARGESALLIGLNAMVGMIGAFVAGPFVPAAIVRFGYRRFSAMAFAVAACVFAALALDLSTVTLFVLRIVLGTALAGLWIATEAWLNHVARESHRGFLNGLFQTGYSFGFFLGPVLYGAVGAGLIAPLSAAAIAVTAGVLSLYASHASVNAAELEADGPVDWRKAWDARGLLAIALLTGVAETAMYTLLPVYGISAGMAREAALWLLVAYTFGEVLLTMPLGWAADHYERRKVLALSGLVAALAILALVWLVGHEPGGSLLALLAGGTVVSLYNLALVIVGERYKGSDLPVVSSAFSMAYSAGCASGSALGGLSMDVVGPVGLPLFVGGSLLVFVVLTLRMFAPSPPMLRASSVGPGLPIQVNNAPE